MKSNQALQSDVQNAIRWEPLLNAAEIGVTVKDGVVTLSGCVDSYVKKMEAEKAAKSVDGVRALVENIEVKFPNTWKKSDGDLASDVLAALKADYVIPHERLTLKVENGWVTLEGSVLWNYQKTNAFATASRLIGVKGVINRITIKSENEESIEQEMVQNAIARCVYINDSAIKVEVHGKTASLSGTVESWYQKEEVERIAWNTPGINEVKNDLEVDYYHALVD